MELSLKEEPANHIHITIAGEFTFSDSSKFREMLKCVDSRKVTHICVNFEHTAFIDSAALGMLLILKEKADQQPAAVQIINASGQVRKVLELSRFQELFDMPQPTNQPNPWQSIH